MNTQSIVPEWGINSEFPAIPPAPAAGAGFIFRSRWVLMVAVAAMAAAVLLSPITVAAQGLDRRPTNASCLAAPVESGSSNVTAVNAFPPLRFDAATQVRQHPLDDKRYYVAERRGVIRTFRIDGGSAVDDRVALDIRDRMAGTAKDTTDSEQWGITSFVFGPGFTSSRGEIFVVYNRRMPGGPVRSHLSRFSSADGRTFNAASERIIASLDQPGRYHHWGQVQLGPDGFLYLGSGDGSKISTLAQVLTSRFGKILKVNVGTSQVQVFARGMRNPWRFTIDGSDMWVGDVGRNDREEVDRMKLSQPGGNYGWPLYEGDRCVSACGTPGLIPPLHAFGHDVGAAVIGGEIYRGSAIPARQGDYIFGASSGPSLFALEAPSFSRRVTIGRLPSGRMTGFFRDRSGEIFLNDATANTHVWRMTPIARTDGEEVASRLTDTGCMAKEDHREFASGVIPFSVNMPMWSDAMSKRRGIALAEGAKISVRADGDFDLPPRTVLLKTFMLENKIVETRLFMNHPGSAGGWRGYAYEWTGSGSNNDATLLASGKVVTLRRPSNNAPVSWMFPSPEQCMQCHTDAAGTSLGLELLQLNRDHTYPSTGRTANQIETWRSIGMFTGTVPPLAQIGALATRTGSGTERRARSYLHANCSFCHRPDGGARVNMDFRFTTPAEAMNVCNVRASGELQIPGVLRLDPGDPGRSLIPIRMGRRDAYKMPPLGSFAVDSAMVSAINAWIRTPGICD